MNYLYNCNVQTPELIRGLSNLDAIYEHYGYETIITAYNLAMQNIANLEDEGRYGIEDIIGQGVWNSLAGYRKAQFHEVILALTDRYLLPLFYFEEDVGREFNLHDVAKYAELTGMPASWPFTDEPWSQPDEIAPAPSKRVAARTTKAVA